MEEEIIFDYSKLEGRIKEKFKSQQNLAEQLSYGKTSLNLKLNNKVSFSQKDILELATLLEIPDEEVSSYFFKQIVRKSVLNSR